MYQRHLVSGVGCYHIAFFIQHLVCIAVVCSQQNLTAGSKYCLRDASHTSVQRFHCLYRGIKDTGVAYHIRICKVQDNQIV